MAKPTIYVETSVWSHVFAEDAPERRQQTLEFLDLADEGAFELFISNVVIEEISRAPEELAEKLARRIEKSRPTLLELGEDAAHLAQRFMDLGAVPPSKGDDARHVAVATVNDLDILVSWNYRHLVNVRRKEIFQHISAMAGYYKPLHIVTPPEVAYERE